MEQTLAAAQNEVQAILLDTSLDRMNGWEILPLLRRLDPECRTPIVLLSVEDAQSAAELPSWGGGMGCQSVAGRCAAGRNGAGACAGRAKRREF